MAQPPYGAPRAGGTTGPTAHCQYPVQQQQFNGAPTMGQYLYIHHGPGNRQQLMQPPVYVTPIDSQFAGGNLFTGSYNNMYHGAPHHPQHSIPYGMQQLGAQQQQQTMMMGGMIVPGVDSLHQGPPHGASNMASRGGGRFHTSSQGMSSVNQNGSTSGAVYDVVTGPGGAGTGTRSYYQETVTPAGTHLYTAQAMGPQAAGQPVNHTNSQVPTAQPVLQKRERKGIAIVNPETNKEVVVEPPFQASQVSITVSPSLSSTSTSATGSVVNTSESATESSALTSSAPSTSLFTDVAAQFAAQVAATLTPLVPSSKSQSSSSHTEPLTSVSGVSTGTEPTDSAGAVNGNTGCKMAHSSPTCDTNESSSAAFETTVLSTAIKSTLASVQQPASVAPIATVQPAAAVELAAAVVQPAEAVLQSAVVDVQPAAAVVQPAPAIVQHASPVVQPAAAVVPQQTTLSITGTSVTLPSSSLTISSSTATVTNTCSSTETVVVVATSATESTTTTISVAATIPTSTAASSFATPFATVTSTGSSSLAAGGQSVSTAAATAAVFSYAAAAQSPAAVNVQKSASSAPRSYAATAETKPIAGQVIDNRSKASVSTAVHAKATAGSTATWAGKAAVSASRPANASSSVKTPAQQADTNVSSRTTSTSASTSKTTDLVTKTVQAAEHTTRTVQTTSSSQITNPVTSLSANTVVTVSTVTTTSTASTPLSAPVSVMSYSGAVNKPPPVVAPAPARPQPTSAASSTTAIGSATATGSGSAGRFDEAHGQQGGRDVRKQQQQQPSQRRNNNKNWKDSVNSRVQSGGTETGNNKSDNVSSDVTAHSSAVPTSVKDLESLVDQNRLELVEDNIIREDQAIVIDRLTTVSDTVTLEKKDWKPPSSRPEQLFAQALSEQSNDAQSKSIDKSSSVERLPSVEATSTASSSVPVESVATEDVNDYYATANVMATLEAKPTDMKIAETDAVATSTTVVTNSLLKDISDKESTTSLICTSPSSNVTATTSADNALCSDADRNVTEFLAVPDKSEDIIDVVCIDEHSEVVHHDVARQHDAVVTGVEKVIVNGDITSEEDQNRVVVNGEVEDVYDDTAEEPMIADKIQPPKYNYSEEQWSPLRPEGKKQYDRSFLLQLRFADLSVPEPGQLPAHLDCVLPDGQGGAAGRGELQRSYSLDPSAPIDFTPGFIISTPSTGRPAPRRQGGGGGGGGSNSMRRDGRGGGGAPSGSIQRVISINIPQVIQLHTTENAWKPALPLSSAEAKTAGELETETLYKKVRGILNKLTPQKFETLLKQVQDLPINTAERLAGCIEIIFEKAISEPNFSVAYAHMAKRLLNLNVPLEANPDEKVSFRKLLLNRCQTEFEKDKQEETDIAEIQRQIDEEIAEEKKAQLIEDRELAISKAKRRSLGLIRFIGELFKLKMLTENIMHECLRKLLRADTDEDSLECLCQLLTTIGQDIDQKPSAATATAGTPGNKQQQHGQGSVYVDMYFKQLGDIAQRKATSARLRFMILDCIDLRKNDWVSRRTTNNPKTIEQIHRDAENEKTQKELMLQRVDLEQRAAASASRNRAGGAGGRGGGMAPPRAVGGAGIGDEGWTAVSRAPRSIIVDPSKMKLSKPQIDENSLSLGPGGRPGMSWQKGAGGGGGANRSVGGAGTQDTERDRPTVTQTPNRFSALTSESLDSRSRHGASPSRSNTDYRGRLSGPYMTSARDQRNEQQHGSSRASQERGMDRRLYGDDNRRSSAYTSSHSASRDTVRPNPQSFTDSRSSAPLRSHELTRHVEGEVMDAREGGAVKGGGSEPERIVLSDEAVANKSKSILEEYLDIRDLKEAIACVQELPQSSLDRFTFHCLLRGVEMKIGSRQSVASLFSHLLVNCILTSDQYIAGLTSVLELSDELVIDISRFWQCLASLIGPSIATSDRDIHISLIALKSACTPLNPADTGRLLALVLEDCRDRLGEMLCRSLWSDSCLSWSEFISSDHLADFIKEHRLEYTTTVDSISISNGGSSNSVPVISHTVELLRSRIDKLLTSHRDDIDKLTESIETTVDSQERKSAAFVRALATSLCNSCITGPVDKYTVDIIQLKSFTPLLKRYVTNDDDSGQREVQALYALQALVHQLQHPSGVLLSFFNTLYDEDVISEDSFHSWRDCSDPSAQTGRGVALSSVSHFFQWLCASGDT